MSGYKNEQRRVLHRGREFHFVSYEARAANAKRGESELPAMWYLMSAGKRMEVMPQTPGQDPEAVDRALLQWLKENVPRPTASAWRNPETR